MNRLTTIYILTYKRFVNIFDTIDSALRQDYPNIELFVSDDGSPNFPGHEITDYIETHKGVNIKSYHVIGNKENVGTVKHINNILRQAKGDLLIPLAGDDLFFDRSVVSRIVERYNLTNFNVLSTSRAMFIEDGKYLSLMPHYLSRERIAKKMATAHQQHKAFTECKMMNFASGSAMTYEAVFLKEMGYFDEKYRLWEDGPFINKMTSKGFAITTAYDIISIKYRGGGVSSGGNPIIRQDMQKFNETDRWINAEEFGWYHKRVLAYTKYKFKTTTLIKRLFYKILYFDVVLSIIIYNYKERINTKYDMHELLKYQDQ